MDKTKSCWHHIWPKEAVFHFQHLYLAGSTQALSQEEILTKVSQSCCAVLERAALQKAHSPTFLILRIFSKSALSLAVS